MTSLQKALQLNPALAEAYQLLAFLLYDDRTER